MTVRFKPELVVVADDDEPVSVDELVLLTREHERVEHLGLSLAEAKMLLLEVQRQLLTRQTAAFLAARVACPSCGRARGVKDHKTIVFRTPFGKLELASPRLRRCPCQRTGQASTSPLVDLLPEHTASELLYLESKWASLVSYGLTVKVLQDFLVRGREAECDVASSSDAEGSPPLRGRTRPRATLPTGRLPECMCEPARAPSAAPSRPNRRRARPLAGAYTSSSNAVAFVRRTADSSVRANSSLCTSSTGCGGPPTG
jgi:hypothetical protein